MAREKNIDRLYLIIYTLIRFDLRYMSNLNALFPCLKIVNFN